ncbi:hypothetical protein FUAX_28290 [Fulvitalea axinellae]|uniref:DUF4249 family protein n=1 Tax=Fulvitalea axinellae TaxID=1182444 RepID=A0AAU9CTL8_9BACT|nr:hypothetical protein FUAX_28290 [Fulvitalea axinellae]
MGRLAKNLFYSVLVVFSLASCRKELVCPAYQSAFIPDLKQQQLYFSPFTPAGEPIPFEVNKDKNGLGPHGLYVDIKDKIFPKLNTIPLYDSIKIETDTAAYTVDVYDNQEQDLGEDGITEEILFTDGDDTDADATTEADSLSTDSTAVKHYHFNREQYVYMLHFAKYLPKPTGPEKKEPELGVLTQEVEEDSVETKRFLFFFKRKVKKQRGDTKGDEYVEVDEKEAKKKKRREKKKRKKNKRKEEEQATPNDQNDAKQEEDDLEDF